MSLKTSSSLKTSKVRKSKDHNVGKLAVVAFGRMAPVTVGHRRLALKLRALAEERNGDALLFLSKTYDGKDAKRPAKPRTAYRARNPLKYQDKLRFVRDALGELVTVMDTDHTDIFSVLRLLNEQGYDEVVLVGEDAFVQRPYEKYNGTDYNYRSITGVSSGTRDEASSDLLESVSATQVREAVLAGDYATFEQLVATQKETAALWRVLRDEMA